MPFLTPNSLPEETDCRSLLIPASSEWLALFGGALTEFLYKYNWEQTTGIGIDETIAKMQEIIDGFYDGCTPCELPGGGKIIRIGADGHFQELGDNGEWQDPTGDYAIPAVTAREGGTPDDQRCLAAKNAAHVLELLYEQVADDWASGAELAQAITNLLLLIAAIIAAPFGLLGEAIIAIITIVFNEFYAAVEFIGADLWDENFTAQLECIFYECSSNTDGVVTFDNDCLGDRLRRQTNIFDLTEAQLRLYVQILYLVSIIGIDGLNTAGTTTAITDDDCSACDAFWGRKMDFRVSDWGFAAYADPVNGGYVGSYESGVGFKTRVYPGGISQISLQTGRTWMPAASVSCIRLTVSIGEYYAPPAGIYVRTAEYEGTIFYSQAYINEAGENVYVFDATDSNGGYNFQLYDYGALENVLIMAEIWGTGTAPDVGEESFIYPPC